MRRIAVALGLAAGLMLYAATMEAHHSFAATYQEGKAQTIDGKINEGATVDQVKAARLTADFDARYGAATGPWTTDMFVEAVYASLKQGRPKVGR